MGAMDQPEVTRPWKCKEARIRKLQQILGAKRPSSTCPSGNPKSSSNGVEKQSTTFAELRTELSKVKCDLQKLMEDVTLTKQSSQKLQLDAKDKALDIEKRVSTQLEDFRRSMKSEMATMKKEQNEKALTATKEMLVKDLSGQAPLSKTKNYNSTISSQLLGQAMLADGIRKDVLPQASSHRLARTAATVRGWLRESPTECDADHDQRPDHHLTNVPTSFLMNSIKDEAKLFSKHHRKAETLDVKDEACGNGQSIAAPAMRILHKRNMRIADLLGSESDDED